MSEPAGSKDDADAIVTEAREGGGEQEKEDGGGVTKEKSVEQAGNNEDKNSGKKQQTQRERVKLLLHQLQEERMQQTNNTPLYVNPAQYNRIMRRREARERMLGKGTNTTSSVCTINFFILFDYSILFVSLIIQLLIDSLIFYRIINLLNKLI